MKVCVGGTFDPLHRGHRALLEKAFEVGDYVLIGLTSDGMAKNMKILRTKGYQIREKELKNYLRRKGFKNFDVVKINDRYGPSINGNFDVIVVSPETEKIAYEINRIRVKNGKKSLKIHTIHFVLADDKKIISSSRIKNGEIDIEGHIKGLGIRANFPVY